MSSVRSRAIVGAMGMLLLCLACGEIRPPGVSQISPPGLKGSVNVAWAPNGERIAVSSQIGGGEAIPVGRIYLLDVAAGKYSVLLESRYTWWTAQSWSPDGKEIAYSGGKIGESYSIWVTEVEGSDAPRFVNSGHVAAWSPAGKELAIGIRAPQAAEIWILDMETEERRLVFSRADEGMLGEQLTWSPGGAYLAFSYGGAAATATRVPMDIYVLDLGTGELRQLTHGGVHDYPTWSPGGRWLAYTTEEAANWRTRIVATQSDGSCSTELLEWEGLMDGLAWSPDGKTIAFSQGEVYLVDIATVMGKDFLSTGPVCP